MNVVASLVAEGPPGVPKQEIIIEKLRTRGILTFNARNAGDCYP